MFSLAQALSVQWALIIGGRVPLYTYELNIMCLIISSEMARQPACSPSGPGRIQSRHREVVMVL